MTDPLKLGDFPLFALDLVALPTETIPLHVFEDRYRTMVELCIESNREFGILWLSEQHPRKIGCACEISEVMERLEDGSLNVLATGTRPFQVLERIERLPYPAGVVEMLEDLDEPPDPEIATVAHGLYADLVDQATDQTLPDSELTKLDAYRMAGTVEFGPDVKQELLETRSENARMRLLALMLAAAIKRLELVDRARARARSNGKVRFG